MVRMLPSSFSVEDVEMLAVLDGLPFAMELGVKKIDVKSDAINVINGINNKISYTFKGCYC